MKAAPAQRPSRATVPTSSAEVPRGECGVPGCLDANCSITYGLCHCGCDEPTALARQTDRRLNVVQGEPQRYVHRHQLVGASEKRWNPRQLIASPVKGPALERDARSHSRLHPLRSDAASGTTALSRARSDCIRFPTSASARGPVARSDSSRTLTRPHTVAGATARVDAEMPTAGASAELAFRSLARTAAKRRS
jgi:hypothetical protein